MTDERFDKLLQVMLEIKDTVGVLVQKVDKLEQRFDKLEQKVERLEQKFERLEQKVDDLEFGQKGITEKLDKVDGHIDLIAHKQWENEKGIYSIKKTLGLV